MTLLLADKTENTNLVNFTLPGLRFHNFQTRAFSSFSEVHLSHPCTPPFLARSSPGLARSSPGPRPFLARPRPVLARSSPTIVFQESSRQNGQREIYYTNPGHLLPQPICRSVSEDFCCTNFGGFSWRIFLGTFPTKMRRKNPARKSAKKSGGPKIKIREKSVLPKSGPSICREKKKTINKNHIKDFGGRYASEVSRGRLGGESQGHPGHPGIISVHIHTHTHWAECPRVTYGTFPRDKWDTSCCFYFSKFLTS